MSSLQRTAVVEHIDVMKVLHNSVQSRLSELMKEKHEIYCNMQTELYNALFDIQSSTSQLDLDYVSNQSYMHYQLVLKLHDKYALKVEHELMEERKLIRKIHTAFYKQVFANENENTGNHDTNESVRNETDVNVDVNDCDDNNLQLQPCLDVQVVNHTVANDCDDEDTNRHLETVSNCNNKKYHCKYTQCEYKTNDSGNMKRHIRVHTNERPYGCIQCGKKFKERGTLVRHTRIHTGEKAFICSICNKQFRLRRDWRTHLKWHNGDFKCNQCGKLLTTKRYLRNHLKSIHSIEM